MQSRDRFPTASSVGSYDFSPRTPLSPSGTGTFFVGAQSYASSAPLTPRSQAVVQRSLTPVNGGQHWHGGNYVVRSVSPTNLRSVTPAGQMPTMPRQFATQPAVQSASALPQLPQGSQKLRRATSAAQYIQQDANGYRTLATSSSAGGEASEVTRARSSSSAQQTASRPEVPRVRQIDELPRFGVDSEVCPRSKDAVSKGSPPAKGSVEAIIEDFKLSMSRSSCLTPRDLDGRGALVATNSDGPDSIREAWANVTSTPSMRSGRITPVEGSQLLEGLSLLSSGSCTRLRSPWHSPGDVQPRDTTTTPSLKAAAAAVVGQGRRSGMPSAVSSPRGRSSPLASPRQMSHTNSARSLMLSAPWQQYKNVANRLQQMKASENLSQSQCSSPRSNRGDLSARGRTSRKGRSPSGTPAKKTDGADQVTPRSQSEQQPTTDEVELAPRSEEAQAVESEPLACPLFPETQVEVAPPSEEAQAAESTALREAAAARKKKGVAALLKGLRSGEVSKIVDTMEAPPS